MKDTSTTLDTLREQTIEAARGHRASWIRLGQFLSSIHHDKLYRTWGFLSFEAYCSQELRIKHATAAKLVRSYAYIEQEKPALAKPESIAQSDIKIPDYEAVNLLRLAQNNDKLKLSHKEDLKKAVWESEKDGKDVKIQLKKMLLESDDRSTKEIRIEKRKSTIKKLASALLHAKEEMQKERFLPDYVLKQIDDLITKLEDQLEA